MNSSGNPVSATALVTIGMVSGAISKWYLVWLFARSSAGAEGVGVYSALIAVATPIFVLVQFGLRNVYLTLLRRAPWRLYMAVRGVGLVVGGVVLLGIGIAFDQYPLSLVFGVLLIKIGSALGDLYQARMQIQGQLHRLGLILVGQAIGVVAVSTGLMHLTESISGAVAGAGIVGLAAAYIARSFGTGGADVYDQSGRAAIASLLRAGAPLTAAQVVASVTIYLPIFFLSSIGDLAVVGLYSAASYLVVFANLLGASLQAVLLPLMRGKGESGRGGELRGNVLNISLVAFVAVAIPLPSVPLWGGEVLGLIYGPEFVIDELSLLLLAIAAAFTVPGFVLASGLLIRNDYRGQAIVSVYVLVATLGGASLLFHFTAPIVAACGTAMVSASARLLFTSIRFFRGRSVLTKRE